MSPVDPLSSRCTKCHHLTYERRSGCVCCTTKLHDEAGALLGSRSSSTVHLRDASGLALCGDTAFNEAVSGNPGAVTCPACQGKRAST